MAKTMFRYATGRFVNPSRILTANIYQKDADPDDRTTQNGKVIRVAIDLDAEQAAKTVVYSDPFPSVPDAEKFIMSIPVGAQD